jgi:hypothetical protein
VFATIQPCEGQSVPPSPEWTQALPAGPVAGTKITEEYAKLVARDAYFWGWPLVNTYNRRLAFTDVREIVLSGPVPAAPLNHLGMLTDYIVPEERITACPNQDVVYGVGVLALDQSPVVIHIQPGWLADHLRASGPAGRRAAGKLAARPRGEDFSLYVRAYWPKVEITDGSWTPPPVTCAQ